jgi:hypothetical protein
VNLFVIRAHFTPLRSGLVQHRESLRDLVFTATSYPDHKRTWAGESKKRSLRRPPQLGQTDWGQV